MTSSRWMRKAALLATPLGALTLSLPVGAAQAADIVDTLKGQEQFSTLAKAMESAGITLQGEGPFTVFAPTDQAFAQLPAGALDALMKSENQEQLKSLLQYHVIEGEEIAAKDAIGRQNDVETLSGERLSVDGTGKMVMLVPTGLTVARVGDRVYVERDVTAVTAPAVEVGPATGERQGQESGTAQQAQTEGGSDMPSSPHQEQVLRGEQSGEQQSGQQIGTQQPQTAEPGDMPSSPHQEQVLRGQQGAEQQAAREGGMPLSPHQLPRTGEAGGPATAAQQAQAEQGSDMPSSPHQEQVLRGEQGGEQQTGQQVRTQQPQTAEPGDMPSSPHQEQVLRGQQGTEQQAARQGGIPLSPQQVPQTGEAGGPAATAQSAREGGMPSSQSGAQGSMQQRQAAQDAGVPSSPHQEQVLRGRQGGERQGSQQVRTQRPQTAEAGDMPSSPHQEQVLRGGQGRGQQTGQRARMQQPQAGQDAGMPSSPHQEQVLRGRQGGERQGGQQVRTQQPQTAEADDMPSSPHQEQVLRGQQGAEQPSGQGGQQETGALREANVVEPDIEADNGVIHAIDAVLVPQSVLSLIEQPGGQSGQEQSRRQQNSGKQG